MAIATGAAGIGVGSAVNKLDNELSMIAAVRGLREAIDLSIPSKPEVRKELA